MPILVHDGRRFSIHRQHINSTKLRVESNLFVCTTSRVRVFICNCVHNQQPANQQRRTQQPVNQQPVHQQDQIAPLPGLHNVGNTAHGTPPLLFPSVPLFFQFDCGCSLFFLLFFDSFFLFSGLFSFRPKQLLFFRF